jgi:hypothetical protein
MPVVHWCLRAGSFLRSSRSQSPSPLREVRPHTVAHVGTARGLRSCHSTRGIAGVRALRTGILAGVRSTPSTSAPARQLPKDAAMRLRQAGQRRHAIVASRIRPRDCTLSRHIAAAQSCSSYFAGHYEPPCGHCDNDDHRASPSGRSARPSVPRPRAGGCATVSGAWTPYYRETITNWWWSSTPSDTGTCHPRF